jgi:D-aspartate ligase
MDETGRREASRSRLLAPGDPLPPVVQASLERGKPWVVQEHVPGPVRAEVAIQLYRTADGSSLHTFIGQKIRSSPPGDGAGVVIRARSAPSAARLSDEVVRACGFHGHGLLTFKRHSRSGRLMLLGITPRHGPWCELAERAGVNLPALAFLDAHGIAGQAPTPVQSDGVYWWDVPADWSNLRRPGMALRDRLGCLVPPLGRPIFPRLSFDDPKPAFGRPRRRRREREGWP